MSEEGERERKKRSAKGSGLLVLNHTALEQREAHPLVVPHARRSQRQNDNGLRV
jgi:hypothetical protein